MGRIDLRCKVLYMPGPWGAAIPAAGVSVRLDDLDVGTSSDTIFTGVTNAAGEFSGLSAEWRDTRNVRVGAVQTAVFDPSDLMSLQVTLSQVQGSLARRVSLPFLPAPANLPQAPIVIPWGPPGMTRVAINGVPVNTLPQIQQALRGLLDTGVAVGEFAMRREITLFGTQMAGFQRELKDVDAQLRELVSMIETLLHPALTQVATLTTNMQRTGAQVGTSMQRAGTQFDALAKAAGAPISAAGTRAGAPVGNPFRTTSAGTQATWETVRARILELCSLMESRARAASNRCAVSPSQSNIVAAVVSAVVAIVVASLTSTLSGVAIVAAVMAAIVICAVTVLQSLPALMRMLDLVDPFGILNLAEPADHVERFLGAGTWCASLINFVLLACFIVMMLAVSPAAGWRWVIEAVTNSEGTAGLRVLFSR